MKIGIIGAGAVGTACLTAVVMRRFAREVSQLCGYDTGQMGQVVARIN